MFNIGGGEMIMLAVLALLVFGPHGLPEIAAKVAKALKTVRRTADEFQREIQTALQDESRALDEEKRRRKRPPEEVEPTEVRKLDAAEETAAAMLSEASDETSDETSEPKTELPEGTHQVSDPVLASASDAPSETGYDSSGESPDPSGEPTSDPPPESGSAVDPSSPDQLADQAPENERPEIDEDGPQIPMRPARPAPSPLPAQTELPVSEPDDGSPQMEDS